jgi:carotenoid 1,2-hydratase
MSPLDFAQGVPQDGYVWWYVDAFSADAAHGITLIAFIGSVFSPYYKFRRSRGPTDAENHCCLNVALYGRTDRRWAMTERGRRALHRTATTLSIGASDLAWDGDSLTIRIEETCAPIPRRLRGTVRVFPAIRPNASYHLDAAGEHRWSPIAPLARVEVSLSDPAQAWSGDGYFDSNAGAVPLEASFLRWNWSRAPLRDGAAILYDVVRSDGSTQDLSLQFDRTGSVTELAAPAAIDLPRTAWRLPRATRTEIGSTADVAQTFTDAPFYARSLLRTRLAGETVAAMHESLSIARFNAPLVQAMLPFRMPRALR